MIKRIFDITFAFLGLIVLWPIIFAAAFFVWLQDFHNPFYIAPRARGKNQTFNLIKIRSMTINADKIGGASTSITDNRITRIGKILRKTKIDELPQLWNVLLGEMSFVGPRPQVLRDVQFYTKKELNLFKARPGITDFSSIVFADEGEILKGSENPDLRYNQVIRPWKSRLGLYYLEHCSIWVDMCLIILTLVSAVSRRHALSGVVALLRFVKAPAELQKVASRIGPLLPYPPPGESCIESRF